MSLTFFKRCGTNFRMLFLILGKPNKSIKMSQKGVSFRLNSHITSIAILIIAAIVYINYHLSNKILVGKIEEGAINQSNLILSKVSRITVGTEEIAKNVAFQALYYQKNNDLNFLLAKILETNIILESIHVELLNEKGGFVKYSSNKPGQIISSPDSVLNEQYILKLKSGELPSNSGLWSVPFYCKNDHTHLLVSYKTPIYYPNSKLVAGVVSCEVSLRELNRLLSEIKIGESGYSFITDKSGNYITRPKVESAAHKSTFERLAKSKFQEMEKEFANGRGGGRGIRQYVVDQSCWLYMAPLTNPNWSILIVIPEKELFKDIEVVFKRIILVSGIGIIVLFFINMFIFWQMLNPLARITQSIQEFSLGEGVEKNSKDEIRMLIESFEDWQAKYGSLISEQTKTAAEKLKYEKDLKSARDIQLNIIPTGKPIFEKHPEIDLFALLKPAEIVGGDLYDYFFIDKNHLLVAIGDVSGKGIPASLFMAIASTLIKANAKILSSKEIVSRVNKELSSRNSHQYFITLFIGILDTKSGILDYCNAAHNYPYILHADGTLQTLSKSHGLPLGIYKNKNYKSGSLELKYGDLFLLYTDGVINSRDSTDQHYGTEKLEQNILHMADLSVAEVVDKLSKSIVIYEGEKKQEDDITLLALRYLGHKQKNQA